MELQFEDIKAENRRLQAEIVNLRKDNSNIELDLSQSRAIAELYKMQIDEKAYEVEELKVLHCTVSYCNDITF
jgi:cell division protein FtsB